MLKVLSFLKRRADLEPRAFRDYYENHHIPLVLSMARAPLVYKRNYVQREPPLLDGGAAIAFDVVTEQIFADQAAFDVWVHSLTGPGAGEKIREDEARFLDHSHYFAYFVEEETTATT